jgi:hypothetical protein
LRSSSSLDALARRATIHCLTGCGIGEVLGMVIGTALSLALAADTASIALMEVIDNAILLLIPGAMDAHVDSALFWGSLAVSLAIAGLAAYPLNRWLIGRGKGHALVHGGGGNEQHGHGHMH